MPYRAFLLALAGLLAAPAFAQSYVSRCSVDAAEALRRINAARAAGHSCGWRRMPPAPPLRWDGALQSAAAGHSRDMAQRNYFDHRSPDGRTVRERVARTGYKMKMVGENLAGGDAQVRGAIQGWLDSPSHCQNMMDARFSEVGVACVGRRGSAWGTYWTMVLGRR